MREVLEKVFGIICNLSLVGSYCILFVLLARLVLRKAPRWCSYLLWGIVFLRLCCPVMPQTGYSLIPQRLVSEQTVNSSVRADALPAEAGAQTTDETAGNGNGSTVESSQPVALPKADGVAGKAPFDSTDNSMGGDVVLSQPVSGEGFAPLTESTPERLAEHSTQTLKTVAMIILPYLWLIGFLGLAGFHLFSYLRMYERLHRRDSGVHQVAAGICEIEGGHLSFVMGILHPTIYLSAELAGESREIVLCHERVHLQRRDYLVKPVALLICCVHWFNPLVWLAFYLMNMDCEMSCDEKVVKLLGEESKKVYSYTLLNEASDGGWKRYRGGTICALLSFGEDHVKNRIRHVLDYRKPPFWILLGAVAVIAALILCLCSNPGEKTLPTETAPVESEPVDLSDTEYPGAADWTQEAWDIFADKLEPVIFETRSDFAQFYSPERIAENHSFAQEKAWYVNHRRYGGARTNWELFEGSREEQDSNDPYRFYDDYRDPVTAAKRLLSLGEGSGEVTEVLYEAARQYQLYSDDRMGEGSVVNVEYTFARDGSVIEIPMVLAEERQQIWLLSTGDVSAASGQRNGPLPGELSARRVYVEYEAYSPENMPTGQYTEYLETKIGSFTGSGIHIQVSSCGIYVMYDHTFECVSADGISENMASAAIFDRTYYNTSNAYNEKVQEDSSIGWAGSKVFYMTEAAEHRQEDGKPTVYTVKEYSLADGTGWELTGEGKAEEVLPFSMKAVNGFVTVYNGNGEIYQQYSVSGGYDGADRLEQEMRDAYSVEWREDILSHPGMVCDISQRTFSETYALIDLDGDAAAERISLLTNDLQDGKENGSVDYTFGVGGSSESRHARLLDNSILAFSPDGEQIVIALYENGDDAKARTVFFTYDGEGLRETGSIEEDIRRAWIADDGIYSFQSTAAAPEGQWQLLENK